MLCSREYLSFCETHNDGTTNPRTLKHENRSPKPEKDDGKCRP